jgi:hypothetical protein
MAAGRGERYNRCEPWEVRRFMSRLRLAAIVTAAIAGATLFMPPANARIIEQEHYSDSGTDRYRDCGMRISNEFDRSGLFMLRVRPGGPTPYLSDRYRYRSVITNLDTGKWIIQTGHGVFKDLHITHVSGTVYRFVSMEAGQPFSIITMDGERIIFDRGMLRTTYLVDTKGDSDLDNDEFIDDSFEILADRGRHPGFYIDYCGVLEDLIG